jgi:probable F420-dependent oxidoreductase
MVSKGNGMKIGLVFPQTEIGTDPAVIRDYAQAAEGLGYTHVLAYDHVLGAGTKNRPDWKGAYGPGDQFHEPLVLFGYMAGIVEKLEFVTGVLVLPQRQTALVAKQAAEVDILSGGRLRLGVGVGWNYVEFEALDEDFHSRGRRVEEQITILRALWTQEIVDFQGHWYRIPEAGINPLPVQRPIPIWIGGNVDATLRRAATIGDGWMPQRRPDDTARAEVEKLHQYAREAGRDPASIGMEARLTLHREEPDTWRQYLEGWRELGATHISVNTMGMGLESPRAHIEMIETAWKELSGA